VRAQPVEKPAPGQGKHDTITLGGAAVRG